MIEREHGIESGGAFQWFMQRISGAVLLITLLGHFWVLHFFPPNHGEITYETVMMRLSNPLWRTFDLLFLVFGLYHGMNGLTMLIHDYIQLKGLRMAMIGVLWIAVVFFMLIGSMTILGLAGGKA